MTRAYFQVIGLASAVAALALGGQASAHHAFAAEFDSKKPVVLDGVVTKAQFVNPHSRLYIDVKNKDGAVTNWGFEFGTPSSLRTAGLTKEDLPPGAAVHVEGFRAKNGGPYGYSTALTLAGGRKIHTGSAPDAPAAIRGR